MSELHSLIPPLLTLCHEAGEAICRHYNAPGADQYQSKGDESPLTRADLDSHDILSHGLHQLDPQLPILSEESSEQELRGRLNWGRFWMVDPLDGTKEFLARTGEFTINIALIDNNKPVLGVLYLPLEQAAYAGIPGEGAFLYQYQHDWQSTALKARSLPEGEPLILHASRRHMGPRLSACLDWLATHWGPIERRNSGSALKFCELAKGEGDLYPRYSPCCEWDTAAGQALLEAAGGALLGLDGKPLRYNCHESLYSPSFYALADPGQDLWQQLLASGIGR